VFLQVWNQSEALEVGRWSQREGVMMAINHEHPDKCVIYENAKIHRGIR
jgi:hypothetical protein